MTNRWGNWLTLFLWGSKITADGGCSHEMKRRLLLGRKVMTDLDSILKSKTLAPSSNSCALGWSSRAHSVYLQARTLVTLE